MRRDVRASPDVRRRQTPAVQGASLEKLTVLLGLGFLLTNLLVVAYWLPGAHHQHVDRLVHPRPAAAPRAAAAAPRAPDLSRARRAPLRRPPPHGSSPPRRFGAWLRRCAARARCSCVQHGVGAASVELWASLPHVAFFVLAADGCGAAGGWEGRVRRAGLRNVYWLCQDVLARGAQPMANDVLNPDARLLTALQALQTSNEFFDVQIVFRDAPSPLLHPHASAVVRSLLALAGATLLLLPNATCAAAWRSHLHALPPRVPYDEDPARCLPCAPPVPLLPYHLSPRPLVPTALPLLRTALPPSPSHRSPSSQIAAAVAIRAAVESEDRCDESGCADDAAADGEPFALQQEQAHTRLLVRLGHLRRVNAHHFSCWQGVRCLHRMYLLDLAEEREASEPLDGKLAWRPRSPRLYRVDDEFRIGPHSVRSLEQAWASRGRDVNFQTGGMNLDTLLALQPDAATRAAVLAEFLALPVGRDMMLWNIIADAHGLYAINQEAHGYAENGVRWEQHAFPYCSTVRECYEQALSAICGRQAPQSLLECVAALTADRCPDPARAFPCRDGCEAWYTNCSRPSASARRAEQLDGGEPARTPTAPHAPAVAAATHADAVLAGQE
ncbi:hypothetical protein AB1Y20_000906 [Prymnesium parvum]|uniref:Uncharacterized protein n=1 Tax=Prymnesium parvum TaxID=97485 RepID=A0AB34K696_PRYPA